MLQSSSSVETKASWAVATAALVTMLMAFGAAWITAVALKDIAAEVDGVRSIPALASALAWLGSGTRRHPDGTDCRQGRHTVDRDLWRTDDRARSHDLDIRPALAAVDRAWAVHRPDRARGHQRADVHLCQSLVRPAPWLGPGADFERQLPGRRDVAAAV